MKISSIITNAEISLGDLEKMFRGKGLLIRNQTLTNILPTSEGLTITITEVLDREFTGSTNRIFTEAEEKILENKSLEDLNLSVRAFNCIKASKIDSLRQLLDYSEDDLTKFRNFGMKSISEIKEVLTKLGLSLSSNWKKFQTTLLLNKLSGFFISPLSETSTHWVLSLP